MSDLDTALGPDPGTFAPYPPRNPTDDASAARTLALEETVRRLPDTTQAAIWHQQHTIWHDEHDRRPHDRRLRTALDRTLKLKP